MGVVVIFEEMGSRDGEIRKLVIGEGGVHEGALRGHEGHKGVTHWVVTYVSMW